MKKNQTFLLIIILLTVLILCQEKSYCQPPAIQWEKGLGGSDNDFAKTIEQTSDGGYIVAGYTFSIDGDITDHRGNADFWLVKLKGNGDIEWKKSLGGSKDDFASCLHKTVDGGFIVVGNSSSTDGDATGSSIGTWILKLNSLGSIEWQKSLCCIGGGLGENYAYSVQTSNDGGYLIAGAFNLVFGVEEGYHGGYDCWIVKLNASGNFQWQKFLGGSKDDWANSIQQTSDGGYFVAGYSNSNDGDVTGNHGESDYWVSKLTANGDIEWQKTFGGSLDDIATSACQTKDGGYIVAGYTGSYDGDISGKIGGSYNDFWLVKLTNTGAKQWEECLGGSDEDVATSVQQTNDGGFIVAGYSSSNDFDVTGNHDYWAKYDYWVAKLGSDGTLQWEKSMGGKYEDQATSICQTADGGYVVAGNSSSNDDDVKSFHHGYNDYWIVKLMPTVSLPLTLIKFGGQLQHSHAILNFTTDNEINTDKFIIQRSRAGQNFDYIGTLKADATPGKHVYSFTDSAAMLGSNYYRLKIQDKDGSYNYSNIIKIDNNSINFSADLSPNPSASSSLLTLSGNVLPATVTITALNGKILWQQKISNGTRTMQLPTANYAAGVYMITVNDGTNIKTLKLVKR